MGLNVGYLKISIYGMGIVCFIITHLISNKFQNQKEGVSGVVVGEPLLEQCATRMLSRWARASHEEIAIGLNLRMVPLILASRTPLPSPLSPFFEFPSYLLLYTSNTAPVPNTRSDPELFCFKKILTNFSSI